MVIVSGITTSRASFSFGSADTLPVMRWTRRRKAATERARSSSDSNAVVSVRRPRCFSWPTLGRSGFGGTTGRTGIPGRRTTGRGVSSSAVCGARATGPAGRGASSPRRFFASASALRRALFVDETASVLFALAGFGGFALGDAARILLGTALGLGLGLEAVLGLARTRIRERAVAGADLVLRQGPQHDAMVARRGRRGRWRRLGLPSRRRRGAVWRGAAGAVAGGAEGSPPGPMTRRFTFSTTTDFERPWLKLCLTMPCSTGRFSVSVFPELTPQRLVARVLRIRHSKSVSAGCPGSSSR